MNDRAALDVYALTNPAFWGLAVAQFVRGFANGARGSSKATCPYPLLFLPMPLAFSQEALARFEGTNRKTGFVSWLERHPIIRATAPAEIRSSRTYTQRAVTFALAHTLLASSDGWNYQVVEARGWKRPRWPIKSDPRGAVLAASLRLGQWCGDVDPATVFLTLGVRP